MERTDAIAALLALGQETRLETFRLLVKAGPEGLPAGEIGHRLAIVQNTMSAHLKVLAQAGLIRSERAGRSVRYRADMACVGALLSYLVEDCCNGAPDLCRPLVEALTCEC